MLLVQPAGYVTQSLPLKPTLTLILNFTPLPRRSGRDEGGTVEWKDGPWKKELCLSDPSSLRVALVCKLQMSTLLYIYNARSSPMSSLFLTVLPPTLLCARLLVLISRSTARYHTHVSELSA